MAINASIDTGLPSFPGAISDPVLQRELGKLYMAFQNMQLGVDRLNVGLATAAATLAYGDVINVYNVAGTSTSRLASAAVGGNPGLAFCSDLQGTASGVIGEVKYRGIISGLSGITPGAIYYLSDVTPGRMITTKPVGAGKLLQPVGIGMDTTSISFNPTLLYTVL